MRQVAKLHLRGKRYNKLKDLSEVDRERLDALIRYVRNMPEMQKCKSIFCRKLAATIKNEYCDPDVALGEFDIATMRAGMTILFIQPVNDDVLNDPNQIRKIFTYWVFNYLKQIIRENSIPAVTVTKKRKMSGEEVVLEEVEKLLRGLEGKYRIIYDEDRISIMFDTDCCSSDVMSILNMDEGIVGAAKFIDLVKRSGCSINVTPESIIITRLKDVMLVMEQRHRENLTITSFERMNDDDDDGGGFRDSLEYRMQPDHKHHEVERRNIGMQTLEDLIPEGCRDVFLVMSYPPDVFLAEFGEDARYDQASIAKFLGQHTSSVKEKLKTIRTALMRNGIVPQSTKHNHDADRRPTPCDDASDGYTIGSKWIDDNGIEYVCTDNSVERAVWEIQMDEDAINVVNLVESY